MLRINFVTYKECLYKECHGTHGTDYRDILYTNILYTLQSLYVTKFIQTLFIRNKIYTGQSLYGNKIYT